MFHFDRERQVQKKNFTRSKRRRKSERWLTRQISQSLTTKFLSKFLWRVANYNLNEQAPHVGAKWVWTKRSRLTYTFIISSKLHFKSNQSSNPLQKLHTEPIFSFAWIPIVVFDNSEDEADWSTTIHASSAWVGKLHITPHKMTPLYRYSLPTLFEY